MGKVNNVTLKRLVYWLTDHSEGSTKLFRMWIFVAFVSVAFFVMGEIASSNVLKIIAILVIEVWSILSLIYLFWEILRGIRFLKFKKKTQKRDKPFVVKQISSNKKMKPKGFNRAG